jgi:hypothetical protein
MPSTRRSIDRQPLPRIWPETLALFVKLEHQRPRDRNKAEVRELAEALDLADEYWCGGTVLVRDRKPCHPPGYGAHDAFFRCRLVRLHLLELAKAAATNPAR